MNSALRQAPFHFMQILVLLNHNSPAKCKRFRLFLCRFLTFYKKIAAHKRRGVYESKKYRLF
jgi:hypothetical protein